MQVFNVIRTQNSPSNYIYFCLHSFRSLLSRNNKYFLLLLKLTINITKLLAFQEKITNLYEINDEYDCIVICVLLTTNKLHVVYRYDTDHSKRRRKKRSRRKRQTSLFFLSLSLPSDVSMT
jgi:hypothetical protein